MSSSSENGPSRAVPRGVTNRCQYRFSVCWWAKALLTLASKNGQNIRHKGVLNGKQCAGFRHQGRRQRAALCSCYFPSTEARGGIDIVLPVATVKKIWFRCASDSARVLNVSSKHALHTKLVCRTFPSKVKTVEALFDWKRSCCGPRGQRARRQWRIPHGGTEPMLRLQGKSVYSELSLAAGYGHARGERCVSLYLSFLVYTCPSSCTSGVASERLLLSRCR